MFYNSGAWGFTKKFEQALPQGRFVFGLTFPNYKNAPALALQRGLMFRVAGLIA